MLSLTWVNNMTLKELRLEYRLPQLEATFILIAETAICYIRKLSFYCF